jgi:hypothetical protein
MHGIDGRAFQIGGWQALYTHIDQSAPWPRMLLGCFRLPFAASDQRAGRFLYAFFMR